MERSKKMENKADEEKSRKKKNFIKAGRELMWEGEEKLKTLERKFLKIIGRKKFLSRNDMKELVRIYDKFEATKNSWNKELNIYDKRINKKLPVDLKGFSYVLILRKKRIEKIRKQMAEIFGRDIQIPFRVFRLEISIMLLFGFLYAMFMLVFAIFDLF